MVFISVGSLWFCKSLKTTQTGGWVFYLLMFVLRIQCWKAANGTLVDGRKGSVVADSFLLFPSKDREAWVREFTHALFRKMMEKVDVLMAELLVRQFFADGVHFGSDALRQLFV